MAKTHKTGKTDTKNGRPIAEYSDGCWRYCDGRGAPLAIRAPEWNEKHNITKATSRAMQQRGMEVRQEKKQAAILKATLETIGPEAALSVTVPHDAAAAVAGELWKETLQVDQPLRDRVYVYERIGADAGLVQKYSGKGAARVQALQINISVKPEVEDGIESKLEILDGFYKELDDEVPF